MASKGTLLIMVARICWVLQLALGSIFWTGRITSLVPLHILIGLIFVLALWALAIAALQAGSSGTMAWVTIVWGLVVLLFGLGQTMILVSDAHPIIQILHLLVGIAALGLAEDLARGLRRERSAIQ